MLKELLLTGLGVAATMHEKVQDELKKLEEKGKINTQDAKSFIESLEAKGKESEDELHAKIKAELQKLLDEMGVATKADLENLKESIIKELK